MYDVAAHGIEIADGMQTRDEIGGTTDAVESDSAHAGHDAHTGNDVGAVGYFDASFADGGIDRAHDVGHDVHRAAAHGAIEERADFVLRGIGIHPVVGGADVVSVGSADEGQMLGSGDIVGALRCR